MSDIMKERERAFEADFFRKQDQKLLAKMRERAALQEVAQALADKLRVDDAELMNRVIGLGLDRENGAAILLAPLVQVAWADGEVTDREREAIFELAATRGVMPGSATHAKVDAWLRERPPEALYEAAIEVMRVAATLLTPAEREEGVVMIVDACRRVAKASGGGLARRLGLASGISHEEAAVIDSIVKKFRDAGPRR